VPFRGWPQVFRVVRAFRGSTALFRGLACPFGTPSGTRLSPGEPPPPAAQVGRPKSEEIEKQRESFALVKSIAGQIEPLSDTEIFEFMSFEEVVGTGWNSFVQVGLALGQIREKRLYRETYPTFESYCRVRWQYGRDYVDRLISAAQVFNRLLTICQQTKPEHESQVRPLIGLTPDQAGQVWEAAVAKAGSRRITAAIVKSAMHDLKIGPPRQRAAPAARQNRAEQHQAIDTVLGELLLLASQQADHRLITAKLEALNSHIQKALPAARPRKKNGA
jgi:hypothetical protein